MANTSASPGTRSARFSGKVSDYPELARIVEDAKAHALLYFGSDLRGEGWPRSDVDLFLLAPRSSEATAFYFESRGRIFHVNVLSPRRFRTALRDPKRLTLHALLVGARVVIDRTDWLARERRRLAAYPRRHRLYQVIERLNEALYFKYELEKHLYRHGSVPHLSDASAFVKVWEARRIDRGEYFGRSVLDTLSPADRRRFRALPTRSARTQIDFLSRTLEPLLRKYLPLWIREIRRFGRVTTYSKLSDKLDLLNIYEEAERRGWLKILPHSTRNHGFPVKELALHLGLKR